MEEKKTMKTRPSIMAQLMRRKISTQMLVAYFFAIMLPVGIFGTYFAWSTYENQTVYRAELLESYHAGVKQTLYEISSQICAVADGVAYNDELIEFLRGEYESEQEVRQAASKITLIDKYMENYVGIEDVVVYIDREDMVDFKQFQIPTEEVKATDWYQKAQSQYAPFWVCAWMEDNYGNYGWRLALVRKMVLVEGDKVAVIVIKIRNSYLSSRINNRKYLTMISVDDMPIFYSNSSSYRGTTLEVEGQPGILFEYGGTKVIEGKDALFHVSSMDMYRTSSDMYLMTYDTNAIGEIRQSVYGYVWILLAAMLLPLFILMFFTSKVVHQVKGLRAEMGKASRGDYTAMKTELIASEELSEAFADLRVMVKDIQNLEAAQYEAEIRQKNIENEQQKMEFKMLASQINPHFLYNTLETIRMKAFTAGDREVATAIKLLGKSMRYVLENTGTVDTTLQKEYDHIMTYLQIQQLRFGERVNYKTDVQPGLDMGKIRMLPLLLQPVVENAIVHGLEGNESTGCIWIAIYEDESVLHIDISDNGSGMDEETLQKLNRKVQNYTKERYTSSIGLYNINRRIKLNYGEAYGLQIYSTLGEGTRVRVLLPVLYEETALPEFSEVQK